MIRYFLAICMPWRRKNFLKDFIHNYYPDTETKWVPFQDICNSGPQVNYKHCGDGNVTKEGSPNCTPSNRNHIVVIPRKRAADIHFDPSIIKICHCPFINQNLIINSWILKASSKQLHKWKWNYKPQYLAKCIFFYR